MILQSESAPLLTGMTLSCLLCARPIGTLVKNLEHGEPITREHFKFHHPSFEQKGRDDLALPLDACPHCKQVFAHGWREWRSAFGRVN